MAPRVDEVGERVRRIRTPVWRSSMAGEAVVGVRLTVVRTELSPSLPAGGREHGLMATLAVPNTKPLNPVAGLRILIGSSRKGVPDKNPSHHRRKVAPNPGTR